MHGRHVLSVDDGNAYLAAGVARLGVLWLPLYVAFPPNRHVSRKPRLFIDWIGELMAQHAPAIQPPLFDSRQPCMAYAVPGIRVGCLR